MHTMIESQRSEIPAPAERLGFQNLHVRSFMAPGDPDELSDVNLLAALAAGRTGLALGALLMNGQNLLQRRVDVVPGYFGILPSETRCC